ncbi:MAG: PAS domain-containing protein [Desulfovibrio sp.]|nr:PAS domain-containing protein [Desulfovibrio sp.]
MTSNRSYRHLLAQNIVRSEIENGKSKQFDPVFADIMLELIDADKDYQMREFSDPTALDIGKMTYSTATQPTNLHEAKHLSISQLVDFGRSMPGGFFVYRAHGDEELIYANDIVFDIFGCNNLSEFKSLTGYTFSGMVYELDLERIENSINHQIQQDTKKLDYVEYRIRRKNGDIRWVDDYGRLVSTIEYGDVFYVLIRDITEQHNTRLKISDMDHLTKA